MVLADCLTEIRRKWMKAFKLFKTSNCRKSPRNRVSPELIRSPSYIDTVEARQDIDDDVRQYYGYRASMPPGNECDSSISTFNSYDSSRQSSDGCSDTKTDSAYNSARSSPAHAHPRAPVCYATVTYFNVNDSEDSSSIQTEYTLLDVDIDFEEDETKQNMINESIELVSAL